MIEYTTEQNFTNAITKLKDREKYIPCLNEQYLFNKVRNKRENTSTYSEQHSVEVEESPVGSRVLRREF